MDENATNDAKPKCRWGRMMMMGPEGMMGHEGMMMMGPEGMMGHEGMMK